MKMGGPDRRPINAYSELAGNRAMTAEGDEAQRPD